MNPQATEPTSVMQNDPLMIIVLFAVSAYLAKLWYDDYRKSALGEDNPQAFPGAVACKHIAIWGAVIGALVILGLEIVGEYAIGISGEQHNIAAIALLSMISAAFFEELIFRGYLVVSKRGIALLVISIVGFSLLFAVIHPFLWDFKYPDGVAAWQFWKADLSFSFTTKAWFSTAMVFIHSLWFYYVRFYKLNPHRSLLPCIAAHLVNNIGVFICKLAQGHVVGWW